jgi:hypothetical protein
LYHQTRRCRARRHKCRGPAESASKADNADSRLGLWSLDKYGPADWLVGPSALFRDAAERRVSAASCRPASRERF